MSRPAEVDIFALSDLATPWCVHVVATLRVADHIAAGISEIDDLAVACNADADMLQRVLEHLASKGVFETPEPGRFVLNSASLQLIDSPITLALDLDGIGGRFALAWSGLLKQVRTGRPAYHEIFGLPFWEDLDAHPELGAAFDQLMGPAGHGAPDPEVLVNRDWNDVRSIVDVGGGTGALLAAILIAHPHVHGTLVDFPRTVANAVATFEAAGVSDRVKTAGQTFFAALPAGSDIYLVNRVLHDWPDAEAVTILQRCAEAMSPAGRVVVVGSVSLEPGSAGLSPETVLVGGKNRNLDEFRQIAEEAGLVVSATGRQTSGRSIIECRMRQ